MTEITNEDLQTQIRLIEAKARPDAVWVMAFTAGFLKAWEVMQPLMAEGIANAHAMIRNQAIDDSLKNLEPVIVQRIETASLIHLKPVNDLLAKQREFEALLVSQGITPAERVQYAHYVDALKWMTNGH